MSDVHIVWITAGLGCDGDSVSVTAAEQPSIEDVLLGAIPGLPKVHLTHETVITPWEQKGLVMRSLVEMGGRDVVLTVGYSHPVVIPLPEGVNAETKGGTMTITNSLVSSRVWRIFSPPGTSPTPT